MIKDYHVPPSGSKIGIILFEFATNTQFFLYRSSVSFLRDVYVIMQKIEILLIWTGKILCLKNSNQFNWYENVKLKIKVRLVSDLVPIDIDFNSDLDYIILYHKKTFFGTQKIL